MLATDDNGFIHLAGQDWLSDDFSADGVDDIAVATQGDNGSTNIRVITSSSTGDLLSGGNGNDTLLAGAGNDELYGGEGADRLNGGTGDDKMSGGGGADIYEFQAGDGVDTLIFFQDGIDLIELAGFAFSDLSITQDGSSARVSYGSDDAIVIHNMNLANLTADDFVFA